jgi:hypothetical protein
MTSDSAPGFSPTLEFVHFSRGVGFLGENAISELKIGNL